MSFKAVMILPGERTSNGLRFATRKEAESYGFDLLSRWFVPTNYEVEESDDPVNHRFYIKDGAKVFEEVL